MDPSSVPWPEERVSRCLAGPSGRRSLGEAVRLEEADPRPHLTHARPAMGRDGARFPMASGCMLVHVRTTLDIDDDLLRQAQNLSGIREKAAIVRAGLEALIARESARRLASLGGTERGLRPVPRRRPARRR